MDTKEDGNELEDWDWNIYTIDSIYKIENKNLLYSTGDSAQCFVVT